MIDTEGKRGVDIGDHNGDIDMAAVKSAGYDFVMIKLGYGSDFANQDDNQFEANVRKAESLGMPWGAWLYSYALNDEQAQSELAHMLRLLNGKRPTMPIALDVEDSDHYRKNHGGWNYQNVTSCTRIVLDGLKAAGYYPMLYTGFEEIENYIAENVWKNVDLWFAHWASSCGYKGDNLCIWQYGGETNLIESNSIPGVGVIDKDLCYRDYPTIIKSGGWNNWGTPGGDPVSGNSGVEDVQRWLNKTFGADLAVDGICGSATKKALIAGLQVELNRWYDAGLEVDGIFGWRTKAAIRNLRKGEKGGYPSILQAFLICHGYDTGGFDGIFGYRTEQAVKAFQQNSGLYVDGIAGKETFAKLAE